MTERSAASGQPETAADRFMNSDGFLARGENMMTTQLDKNGRLKLEPALRQRYGTKFYVVEMPGKLVLLPVHDEAVRNLEEWGKAIQHLSLEEIKRIIDKRAMEEVGA